MSSSCIAIYHPLYTLFVCIQSTEIPESRGLFVIFLLADMLNTILQLIITLSYDGQPDRSHSTAAIVVFVLVGVFFFCLLTVVYFVYLYVVKHHHTTFVYSTVQAIGGLFYYFGNNFVGIVFAYRDPLGCDRECVSSYRIASSVCLGFALIIFQFFPSATKQLLKVLKHKGKAKTLRKPKRRSPDWLSAVDMITVLVKMDILYSAIVEMVQSDEFCSPTDFASSVAFFTVCILVGIGVEIIFYNFSLMSNKKDDEDRLYSKLVGFGLVAMLICLPLYLLSDNRQPLDCVFGCDNFALPCNASFEEIHKNCHTNANDGTRFAFIVIAFALISTTSVLYFSCHHPPNCMKTRMKRFTVDDNQKLSSSSECIKDANIELTEKAT